MMNAQEIEKLLTDHGVRPTANRIVVAKALARHDGSYSLSELEDEIGTIDKSGIFRTLTLFKEHHLVHSLESSEGTRYELCLSHNDEHDDDTHVHFYCERCMKTFCLPALAIPPVDLPQGYVMATVNYVVKGLCPACSGKL